MNKLYTRAINFGINLIDRSLSNLESKYTKCIRTLSQESYPEVVLKRAIGLGFKIDSLEKIKNGLENFLIQNAN